ncbi:MAG: hypothetical protein HY840_15345 [Bacteroidetes bacterium]|nr:hypothetical protein [Bacteroidota bacterium]
MSHIIIEVDEQIARAFTQADKQQQRNISMVISSWLKKLVNTSSLNSYKQMLDAMSDEACKNGLTPEKLEHLLKEND